MAKDRFNIVDILSGLNPNIDADILKAARYFTRGDRDLMRVLGKPSKAEKRTKERLGRVKSEDVLKQEIADLFAGTRAEAEKASATGAALGESLAQAVRSAAGGVAGATGADSAVSPLLQSAMQAGEGIASEVRTGLESLGSAAQGSIAPQQAASVAAALLRRSEETGRLEDALTELEQERQTARRTLMGDQRTNWLTMVSSLLGLKPSGSGSGSGSGATSAAGRGALGKVNIYGQRKYEGDVTLPSGYYLYDSPGQASDVAQTYGVTGGSVPRPTQTQPPRRPTRGPWSTGL